MNHNGKASDLGFGHFGNGITVWDRSRKSESNDYLRVAHIDRFRQITYYKNAPVSQEQRQAIEKCAATDDPNISATQEMKIFTHRPEAP